MAACSKCARVKMKFVDPYQIFRSPEFDRMFTQTYFHAILGRQFLYNVCRSKLNILRIYRIWRVSNL